MGFLAEERYDSMNDRYANLFHARNENKEFRLEDHDFTIYMDTVQKDYHVSEVRGKNLEELMQKAKAAADKLNSLLFCDAVVNVYFMFGGKKQMQAVDPKPVYDRMREKLLDFVARRDKAEQYMIANKNNERLFEMWSHDYENNKEFVNRIEKFLSHELPVVA